MEFLNTAKEGLQVIVISFALYLGLALIGGFIRIALFGEKGRDISVLSFRSAFIGLMIFLGLIGISWVVGFLVNIL